MHRRRENPGDEAGLAHDGADEVRHTTPVSQDDLATVEDTDDDVLRASESLARLQGDQELRDALARDGFTGRRWDRFTGELAGYGLAVMTAWLYSGEIFAQCKKKNCSPGPAPLDWTAEDRQDLADDTVVQAIINFQRHALVERRWRIEGGASLKTYFIGSCVFAFPNYYRKWLTERSLRQQELPIEHTTDDGPRSDDPVELAINRMRIAEGLDGIPDDRTKKAIIYQEMGYTYDEIAELLDTTRGAVNQLLGRHRRRIHRNRGSAGGDMHA
jgi:RNA polymerase sigma factor (sigma-70 family)